MLNAQTIVELLEDALKTDPAVISTLFGIRRSCNQSLADHPYIQVAESPTNKGTYYVGFVGLINGMLGSVGSEELVAIVYDDKDNQNVIGFKVVRVCDLFPPASE